MSDFQFMLAPIEDVTGNALRTICFKYGADLTFTVMTRAEGLARKNAATWSRLDFKDETPTVIQLIGAKEIYFKKFLSMFKPGPGFRGFNLNIGCPSPDVIKIGQGSAMIKRIAKVQKIVQIFKDRKYPISVKLRLGLNTFEKEKKVYLNLIKAVNADYFIVHARHAGQTYADKADFSVYEECVKTGKTIIANGDIKTKEQVGFLKNIGVKGVMIGRAAVADPAIFSKLKGIDSPKTEDIVKELIHLSEQYNESFKYRKNVLKWAEVQGIIKE